MRNSSELKAEAREVMIGKYGSAIGVLFLVSFLSYSISSILDLILKGSNSYNVTRMIQNGGILDDLSLLGNGSLTGIAMEIILLLLFSVFITGESRFFLNICRGQEYSIKDIFFAFKNNPDKTILVYIWMCLESLLPLLPFIVSFIGFALLESPVLLIVSVIAFIAGMIGTCYVSFGFFPCFYMLSDDPSLGVTVIVGHSKALMKGKRFRFFYLCASFLGLYALGLLSLGIAYLWIKPYMDAAFAEFYIDLIKNENQEEP
ncbi:MAG: DUF975 family protein [Lachnospiraceae bacterium]|nr:DUF975 family protein [Lachnospiraceae bacterium]